MKKQFMNVNGEQFLLLQPNKWIPSSKGQLEDCYIKPSSRKKAIYDSWWEWACTIPGDVSIWVHSFNCHFFTLGGEIWNDTGHWAFYITYTRQEIWKVVEE